MKKVLVVVILASMVAAIVGVKWWRSRTSKPVLSTGGMSMQMASIGSIPFYLQGDPDWASLAIGGSGESMAAVGCTVTCISMGLSGLGYGMTPAEVCEDLKTNGGFTNNGYVIWKKIGLLTNGAVEMEPIKLSHERIDRELGAGRPVVAKVMLGGTIQHWLLIVGKQDLEYLAMDPLNPSRQHVPVSKLSNMIYAIRVFRTR